MQYNKKISKNNKGFTLLELIVTVVILAIVTAPFLSSFITASNTNVKSKRIQEANELSQYIIEKCKASNVSGVISDFNLTDDDGNGKYVGEFNGSNSGWPVGFSDKYKAEIEFEPSAVDINTGGIPEIENLNKLYCCVLTDILYKYDSSVSSGAVRKVVTVNVTESLNATSQEIYIVKLKIAFEDISNRELSSGSSELSWTYLKDDCPATGLSVYILYPPFADYNANGDEINITNDTDSNVNFYIINQSIKNSSGAIKDNISPSRVEFKDKSNTEGVTMETLYDDSSEDLNYITVYTNIKSVADIAKKDYKNEIIKLNNINTLYDVKVKISYLNSDSTYKKISDYEASKIELIN